MTLPEYEHEWQAELDRLRAEVATLREELEEQGALAQEWGDAYRREKAMREETEREVAALREELGRDLKTAADRVLVLEVENQRARKLLARWEDAIVRAIAGMKAMHHRCPCTPGDDDHQPGCPVLPIYAIEEELEVLMGMRGPSGRTDHLADEHPGMVAEMRRRAFPAPSVQFAGVEHLGPGTGARDEARRCTCGLAQHPGLMEHTPNCGECEHRWVKERGVDVDWCQGCGMQRPHARDEARRCTCDDWWLRHRITENEHRYGCPCVEARKGTGRE